MALVAKCTGGKRVNYSKSISYTTRAYGAAISHSVGPAWHLHTWKGRLGENTRKILAKRKRIHDKRNEGTKSQPKKRRDFSNGPDMNYGPNAAQPDIPQGEMSVKKTLFLNKLKDRISDRSKLEEIEEKTRGQHDNSLWRELRQDYLTASNFGTVVKRRATTPCHNLVKALLYKNPVNTPGILYGRVNEKVAIEIYERLKNVKVKRCGLFIDVDFPFLGASPDGLIGDDGLIEVKSFQSIKGKLKDYSKPHCYTINGEEVR